MTSNMQKLVARLRNKYFLAAMASLFAYLFKDILPIPEDWQSIVDAILAILISLGIIVDTGQTPTKRADIVKANEEVPTEEGAEV